MDNYGITFISYIVQHDSKSCQKSWISWIKTERSFLAITETLTSKACSIQFSKCMAQPIGQLLGPVSSLLSAQKSNPLLDACDVCSDSSDFRTSKTHSGVRLKHVKTQLNKTPQFGRPMAFRFFSNNKPVIRRLNPPCSELTC